MRYWTKADLTKGFEVCHEVSRSDCERNQQCRFRHIGTIKGAEAEYQSCHPIEVTEPAEKCCADQSEPGGKCGMEFAHLRKEIVALEEQHERLLEYTNKRLDVFVDQFAKLEKRKVRK